MTIDMITDVEQKVFFEETYKQSHDIAICMNRWTAYQRTRELAKKAVEEAEAAKKPQNATVSVKAEEIPEKAEDTSGIALNDGSEQLYTRVLNVRGTKDQLNKLAAFMTSMGIEFWGENRRKGI